MRSQTAVLHPSRSKAEKTRKSGKSQIWPSKFFGLKIFFREKKNEQSFKYALRALKQFLAHLDLSPRNKFFFVKIDFSLVKITIFEKFPEKINFYSLWLLGYSVTFYNFSNDNQLCSLANFYHSRLIEKKNFGFSEFFSKITSGKPNHLELAENAFKGIFMQK